MKNVISIITAFILMIAIISCGGVNKETNQSEQNTQTNQTSQNNNAQNTQTNTSQTNNQKEFFDMKYVYKGVRVDKAKFDEELKNLRENNEKAKRNFDFLNRKFANDDERKKYSIEFISNVNFNYYPFSETFSSVDIYNEDLTDYYADEHLYVDQNLALKKAREELLKLNKKDADVYLALFLSHFACDSLYYFEEEKKYLTEWKKAGGTNISMIIAKYDGDNAYSNKMKLVDYIIEAPDSLRAEKLVADAYNNGFSRYIAKNNGYIDLFNENNYSLSSIEFGGTAHIASVNIVPEILNTNIINKYLKTYVTNILSNDKLYFDDAEYFRNYYGIDLMEYYDGWNRLSFLQFKKNTFLIESTMNGPVNIHYYNPEFMNDHIYASFEEIKTYNFRLGDINKVESAEINSISTNDLKDYTKGSKFISFGKFDGEKYLEYIDETMGWRIYFPSFFLCDINNDGKEELMLSGGYDYSGGRGGVVHYTLLLKDNLEVDFDSEIGQLINNKDFQDLECIQKIYTEAGKNKMFLLDKSYNKALDIFIDNNEIKNADYFNYITYSYQPKLEWKGSILDGVPEGALKTDASFDMSKAENASDKAIVSDRTLRMADKLISDAYFAKKATLDKQGQEELLEQRRAEIKTIQEAKGDIKAIEAEMLKILNIQ
ncbi:lysozyme inhibitor LprI family protein [Brachyspira hyodysenteriae]|uniref:hypothetical protein n=3 Tax=Brachyspira TaxID=29521 RepID=UPI0011841C9C|nr:hypothetical protein [Brachyspira hyodysenteriae]TVL59887.1 hypothetical protein A9X86_00145 [Brachyspira hyodysenteriae]TVL79455.1 hypothetical protein A9X82_07000 [Brachyspira hyodysenteriae]